MLWKPVSYANSTNSHQKRRMIIRWLEVMVGYFSLKPPTHPTLITSFANHPLKPSRTHAAVTYTRRRRPITYARESGSRSPGSHTSPCLLRETPSPHLLRARNALTPSTTREERCRPVNLHARNAFANGRRRRRPVYHGRRAAGRCRLATSRWINLLPSARWFLAVRRPLTGVAAAAWETGAVAAAEEGNVGEGAR